MPKKAIKKETPAEEVSKENTSIQIIPQAQQPVNPNTRKPYTNEQIKLITRTVAKGATNDELALFMIVANKCGLDPFSKQIHFVKRKQKQKNGDYIEVGSIQTGIDGFRTIAERSGGYAGSDDIKFDTEDAKHPNKATATVYKIVQGVRVPYTASARWVEYVPSSPNDFMWNKMPYHMLGKVAEALALRKAFPNDLSGIYVEEEVDRIGTVVTDPSTVTVKSQEPAKEEAKPVEAKAVEVKKSPLDPLFETARRFGAKQGEEAVFIQESLGIDIDWEQVNEKVATNYRTQLMSKLTPR